jgi:hypothetical protein
MKAVILTLLILFGFIPVSAQTEAGTIEGVVQTIKGIPIADASVYAVDLNNVRKRFKTTTTSDGRFALRDIPPSTYSVHAYKESEGYADTFYAFFGMNKEAWRRIDVQAGSSNSLVLKLSKYATLKLSIEDEKGNPVSGSLTFRRTDNPELPYIAGASPNMNILVPPVPFRFQIEAEGYEIWNSQLIKPRSGQKVTVRARLKRSR